jgi:hypothetical protein
MNTHTLFSEIRYGRRTANKDVHFVVTKRTAEVFSLLSYTVHCYPGIEFVSWCSIPYAGKANNGSLFTNSTQWAGTNKSYALRSCRAGFLSALVCHAPFSFRLLVIHKKIQ